MTSQARTPDDKESATNELTPTQLFTVFADERRQMVLSYLSHRQGAVLVGDIAEYIAIAEGNPTQEWYERISTDLYHSHLPHMQDIGLLLFNLETEQVSLTANRRLLTPYLDLAGYPEGE
jgi:hypothetical protein